MTEGYAQLRLENQICFPIYSVSRIITQQYKPFLNDLGVTYPQYLVLLVLWEKGEVPIKEISDQLFLETNTLTPLLKRMQANGIIERNRSTVDERIVLISLTSRGDTLRHRAKDIPSKIAERLNCLDLEPEDAIHVKGILDKFLASSR